MFAHQKQGVYASISPHTKQKLNCSGYLLYIVSKKRFLLYNLHTFAMRDILII